MAGDEKSLGQPPAADDMPEPRMEEPESVESVAHEVEPLGAGNAAPLGAEPPEPPAGGLAETVDELDERIRKGGPKEVERADAEADAVEDEPGKPSSGTDSGDDPTTDPNVTEPPD